MSNTQEAGTIGCPCDSCYTKKVCKRECSYYLSYTDADRPKKRMQIFSDFIKHQQQQGVMQ